MRPDPLVPGRRAQSHSDVAGSNGAAAAASARGRPMGRDCLSRGLPDHVSERSVPGHCHTSSRPPDRPASWQSMFGQSGSRPAERYSRLATVASSRAAVPLRSAIGAQADGPLNRPSDHLGELGERGDDVHPPVMLQSSARIADR